MGFIENLKNKLEDGLPGVEGQKTMAPMEIGDSRFGRMPSDARKAAVLCLFYQDGKGEWRFPLIQRPEYPGSHGGQVSFPGGKIERQERAEDAALRETHEEIGVWPDEVRLLGNLSDLYIPVSGFVVSPFLGYASAEPTFKPDPREVSGILYPTLEDLSKQFSEGPGTAIIETSYGRMKVPSFDVDGSVVWGATAIIIGELLTLLKD
ncbi:coenzyme A pyrophosphatase [Fulvitalea axinellae]|uniref:Coenzyme A pyrophosphatase n=1 Tax=Fulvitalea axinellae TaxID=1182444 RepID=A0AAU9CCT4_9BACT|nr:coenzyme A pyrophosphatase [Fulvitalea axinellae]